MTNLLKELQLQLESSAPVLSSNSTPFSNTLNLIRKSTETDPFKLTNEQKLINHVHFDCEAGGQLNVADVLADITLEDNEEFTLELSFSIFPKDTETTFSLTAFIDPLPANVSILYGGDLPSSFTIGNTYGMIYRKRKQGLVDVLVLNLNAYGYSNNHSAPDFTI